ncbi:restriction endonuclease subunit S [Stenotrophomonas sp.]|uniref:restriction endonuclease subunit S n=1 Tax=Stenotrophomonas sp. TaxID=69392 RepID=UPI0028986517|nr:restriction endonuclease subunit S [Stenotrophomonas sp.]
MSAVGLSGCQDGGAAGVPADWVVLQIGEMTEVSAGGTPATGNESYWFPPEVPWMSSGEVHKRRIFTTEKRISILGLTKSAAKLFPKKSVVMALAGQGKTRGCVAVLEAEVATNQSLAAIYPSKAFDTDFLFHNLDWRYKELRSLSSGEGGRGGLNLSIIKSVPIGLPPLLEQRKIAAILTAVDDKLDVIARQIEATQTLKQGLMQTLFAQGVGTQDADGRWVPHAEFKESELGEIPAGWTLMPLEELAVENITYGVVQPGESVEGGVPLVRGGDIKGGRIAANLRTVSTEISNQFKRTILKGGELLVSLVGYPGETVVVPGQLAGANIARQAGMIRTGSVSMSEFIHCYLSSPVGKSFLLAGMIGSAQQVINLKALREVVIPLPTVAERERICSICSAVTKKLQALEDKQSGFQDLKRGLMQKLLTGEWRVSLDAIANGT